jgi:hypothetical protein
MKIGSVGTDVMLFDVFDYWKDKTEVPTTGQYGVKTSWAVRNFQKRQNINPTGIMDANTYSKLQWCWDYYYQWATSQGS